MFDVGVPELVLILGLALIIFGPGKLPEVGKSLGKTIREFKSASKDIQDQVMDGFKDEPVKSEVSAKKE